MHAPLEKSEFAAASQDRGGLTEARGRVATRKLPHSRTPRAACSRGVGVFVPGVFAPIDFAIRDADRAYRQVPHLPPPAPSRLRAGLRIVET